MKSFIYTKANKDVSVRKVHVIKEPSDSLFCLDLTEFDEAERQAYSEQLEKYHASYVEGMKALVSGLGLGSNYRRFKDAGIEYLED